MPFPKVTRAIFLLCVFCSAQFVLICFPGKNRKHGGRSTFRKNLRRCFLVFVVKFSGQNHGIYEQQLKSIFSPVTMTNTELEDENYVIQIRAKLNEKNVKLWEPPFYNPSTLGPVNEPELEVSHPIYFYFIGLI